MVVLSYTTAARVITNVGGEMEQAVATLRDMGQKAKSARSEMIDAVVWLDPMNALKTLTPTSVAAPRMLVKISGISCYE